MTQRTLPTPNPCYLFHFQIFEKIVGFQKKLWIPLGRKKKNCIFEELSNLYLIVLLFNSFPLLLWITTENRTKLKKLFIWTTKSGETQHHKQKTAPDCSSETAIMLLIFWTEHDFCIICDCKKSFNNKLKNLWTSKKFL